MMSHPMQAIDVLIVDDARLSELHAQYLNDPTTTDVLTFNLAEKGEAMEIQVVICADAAARQAGPRGHSIEFEVLLYAIHGLLHCSGFDDHSEAECVRVHREEDRILEAIGVGKVFGRGLRGLIVLL
jgi:probable rRNA maturation factor